MCNWKIQWLDKKYHIKDLVTHEIFEDFLKDEVNDEDWENFLPSILDKWDKRTTSETQLLIVTEQIEHPDGIIGVTF